ncbi:SURF1-domain-containing protein [Fistulina hepatica ATCC 64428]|uniref:SURF1-like protein n=1 Tax=Fistulina hepatica ATCC 64428 TaxID=1128425 RepID=A0A0D7AHP9_9AGAR|nr:SURF1-domain-containing protein [Fistulina hepatica ATCC 64428]
MYPLRHALTASRNLFNFRRSNVPALYKPKTDSFFSPILALVATIPIFTFGLGIWQLKRLKWKVNLIDELEEKLQLDPLHLPLRVNLKVLPEFTWRKVYAKGVWDHAHTMLVGPRVYNEQQGFHVVTPLARSDGSTVLVDRGFVTREGAKKFHFDNEDGEVEVLGMLRQSQPKNFFTPANKPDEGIWYWTDVGAMAQYAGGSEVGVQPVFIEEVFDGNAGEAKGRVEHGIPLGRPATVDLRNAHLSYVITWFGLSAFTSFMLVRRRLSIDIEPFAG